MLYVGMLLVVLFNVFVYYDHTQNSKELFEDKKLALNITIFLFMFVELFLFIAFYYLGIKLIEVIYG